MADTGFLPPPPGWAQLAQDEVHVWLADLECQKSFTNILAPDELAKAARFHFQKDREHYVAARGVLRSLLASYVGVPPETLQFQYNEHGKPRLAAELGRELEFNLSHAHGLALYAFSKGRKIGVDIEWMHREVAYEELAERFFAPTEVAAVRVLPKELRKQAFFNGWTRKEAFIKAHGKGLSLALDKFAVSLEDDSPALLSLEGDVQARQRWTLRAFVPRDGYAAALAVEGPISSLKCWQWTAEI